MDISEAIRDRIPSKVSTIHRFLKPDHRGRFRHNHRHPVVTDLVMVDEVSMVDLPLMSRLLGALPDTTRLILLGDRYQLSSVEAGSVLADICGPEAPGRYGPERMQALIDVGAVQPGMIDSDEISSKMRDAIVELQHSYRFDANSGIGVLARLVNDGETSWPAHEQVFDSFSDITQYDWGQGSELTGAIQLRLIQWFAEYLKADSLEQAWQRLNQVRVLCATRQGVGSVEWMNQLVEEELISQGLLNTAEEFYHGRPIMVTRNDYGLGIFNGDVGLVWEDEQGRFAWFEDPDGGLRPISVYQLPEHETAYALTVHKSQGSEYDRVLMVLPEEQLAVVTRELIYTGITRAKSEMAIVTNPEVFTQGCARRTTRGSGLAQRLGWA
jgi:exodeoxyribonuclease V alpha subunit